MSKPNIETKDLPPMCWHGRRNSSCASCTNTPMKGSDYCSAHINDARACLVARCPYHNARLCPAHSAEYAIRAAEFLQRKGCALTISWWLAIRVNTHEQEIQRNRQVYREMLPSLPVSKSFRW